MKLRLIFMVIPLAVTIHVNARPLPSTPFETLYHALFNLHNDIAMQEIINLWATVSGQPQKKAWRQALETIISHQCGKDLPVVVPEWLDQPTLTLVQRDMPLNRIYRIELSGSTQRRNLRAWIVLPDGDLIPLDVRVAYGRSGEYNMESRDLFRPLRLGVYHLAIKSDEHVWRQSLALQGVEKLDWIEQAEQTVNINAPPIPATCPPAWLEQTLLRISDYSQLWWHRPETLNTTPWPSFNSTEDLWTSTSIFRVETRGGLALRFEHRLAGPIAAQLNTSEAGNPDIALTFTKQR